MLSLSPFYGAGLGHSVSYLGLAEANSNRFGNLQAEFLQSEPQLHCGASDLALIVVGRTRKKPPRFCSIHCCGKAPIGRIESLNPGCHKQNRPSARRPNRLPSTQIRRADFRRMTVNTRAHPTAEQARINGTPKLDAELQ